MISSRVTRVACGENNLNFHIKVAILLNNQIEGVKKGNASLVKGFKNIKVSEKHLYYIDLQGIFLMIMLFLLLARLLWQKILLIKIKI